MDSKYVLYKLAKGEEEGREEVRYKNLPTKEDLRKKVNKSVNIGNINEIEVRELIKELQKGSMVVLGGYVWYINKGGLVNSGKIQYRGFCDLRVHQ